LLELCHGEKRWGWAQYAATVNNRYLYNKNKLKEERTLRSADHARYVSIMIAVVCFLLLLGVMVIVLYIRNQRFEAIQRRQRRLEGAQMRIRKLKQDIEESLARQQQIIALPLIAIDAAESAFIELVDFDENMMKQKKAEKKTRRSRRSKKAAPAAEAAEATAVEAPAEEASKSEAHKAE